MLKQITVSSKSIEEAEKLLANVSKKAKKYGVAFSYSISEEYAKKVKVYESERDTKPIHEFFVACVDITIDSEMIKCGDYTVMAKIEHGLDTNVVTTFTDESKPEWWTVKGNCEHCNTNQERKHTFIVKNDSTGELKQVGSSCLKDYTGIVPEMAISWLRIAGYQFLDSYTTRDWASVDGMYATMFETKEVVAIAVKSIRVYGYVRSSEENSTKKDVFARLATKDIPTEQDIETANEAISFVNASEDDSDLVKNLKSILSNEYIKPKYVGYLSFVPAFMANSIEKKNRESKKVEESKSEYVGKVGDKLTIDVQSIKMVTTTYNSFGASHLYKITDANGNVFIWWTGNDLDLNATKISGTVKEYNEFANEKQTVLTRCKVVKDS